MLILNSSAHFNTWLGSFPFEGLFTVTSWICDSDLIGGGFFFNILQLWCGRHVQHVRFIVEKTTLWRAITCEFHILHGLTRCASESLYFKTTAKKQKKNCQIMNNVQILDSGLTKVKWLWFNFNCKWSTYIFSWQYFLLI